MTTYLEQLMQLYRENAEVQYADWSKQYMRQQFEFLGIRSPNRKELNKQFFKEYGLPEQDELQEMAESLWVRSEREFQYFALDVLRKMVKKLRVEDLAWIEDLITQKSWWDTVDVIAPHIAGILMRANPILLDQYADHWIESDNIWLQRSAIIYQLSAKEQTGEERLYRYIEYRANSEEFFVQKAIGWALRQYARSNPASVSRFVASHELKPLSRREALKHLK